MTNFRKTLCDYPGGKATHMPEILPNVPKKATGIIEVYGGAANLLLAIGKRPLKVYNDMNGDMTNLFAQLRDLESASELQRMLTFTLYSEESLRQALATWHDMSKTAVERAWATFVILRMARYPFTTGQEGFARASQYHANEVRGGGKTSPSKLFPSKVDRLWELVNEIRTWDVPCQCEAVTVINAFDRPGNLLYCDPPYLRKQRGRNSDAPLYGVEMMGEGEHMALLDALKRTTAAMRLVSHYPCELYDALLGAGWTHHTYQAGTNGKPREERLYICPRTAVALQHDKRRGAGQQMVMSAIIEAIT